LKQLALKALEIQEIWGCVLQRQKKKKREAEAQLPWSRGNAAALFLRRRSPRHWLAPRSDEKISFKCSRLYE
jgi:hypothetical protein